MALHRVALLRYQRVSAGSETFLTRLFLWCDESHEVETGVRKGT